MAKTKPLNTRVPSTEAYSAALTLKSQELRSSMSIQNAAQVVGRTDHPSDEGDLGQQSNNEWIFLNRNRLESKVLREVEEALRRIDTEHFGVCQECEEPISLKRLNALPWAKYCVACQELVSARKAAGEYMTADDNE